MAGKQPVQYILDLMKEHDGAEVDRHAHLTTQISLLERKVDALTDLLQQLAEAMTAAVELEEQAPPQMSQAELLAEAISSIAKEQDDKPKTAFPAWGAPLKED